MKNALIAIGVLLFLVVASEIYSSSKGPQYFQTKGYPVEVQFPVGWYGNPEKHPYDLQVLSPDGEMNTGVWVYNKKDMATTSTPQKIFEFQIDDIRRKRENFVTVHPKVTEEFEGKIITTTVTVGDKNNSRFYYIFSLVEFGEDSDLYAITLQVTFPSSWDDTKDILAGIVKSTRLIEEVGEK